MNGDGCGLYFLSLFRKYKQDGKMKSNRKLGSVEERKRKQKYHDNFTIIFFLFRITFDHANAVTNDLKHETHFQSITYVIRGRFYPS